MNTHHEVKPLNTLFWGRRWRGKTLSMAAIAFLLKQGFLRHRSHWKVVSNHWLEFADYNSPYLVEEFLENPFMLRHSIVCVDEVTASTPSRRAMAGLNINMARHVEQIRKLPCEFMFTTQFPTQVDKSLLEQIDIFILCDAHIHPYARVNPKMAAMSYVDLFGFDWWGQFTGRYGHLGYWPPSPMMADFRMRLTNLPAVWGRYYSQELIPTQWGSEAYRDRVEREHWEMIDEGLAEAQSNPDALPENQVMSLTSSSFEQWINKMGGGGGVFIIRKAMVEKAQKFVPAIQNLDHLKYAIDKLGYEVTRDGPRTIATRRTG